MSEDVKVDSTHQKKSKTQKISMGEKIKNWWKGLKAEFNKIIWTDKQTLGKQTFAVVTISIILGAIIAVVDSLALQGINFLIK